MPYFDVPIGRVKIQTNSKNYLLHNKTSYKSFIISTPQIVMSVQGNFAIYLHRTRDKYAKRNRIGTGNPAN